MPAKLLAALTKAGMRINRVGDPFLALAQLCKSQRRNTPAAAEAPNEPRSSVKLVILFPEMLTDAAEFCAAADIYAPGVPRWQYGPAANPELRAIVDADMARWAQKNPEPVPLPGKAAVEPAAKAAERPARPGAPTSRTLTGTPQLRLAGDGPALAPLPSPAALDNPPRSTDEQELAGQGTLLGAGEDMHAARSRSHLITDEELRMLLGESNEDKPEHGTR